jgi:hypothetical protein
MWKPWGLLISVIAGASACVVGVGVTCAQSPEQAELWERQRAQALADQKQRDAELVREREARRADPMAWVHSLDPMTSGGWQFRAVASDGSWAAYSTDHQLKRSGHKVTVWLRQEYAEPQTGGSGPYSSVVEKMEYDCARERGRPLVIVYYSRNNAQGSEQTEEADASKVPWTSIVPGTREENEFLWACRGG